ncbi:MAG TPA: helicase C-terminal domain-containing protein, partial [Trueperaceae bacterium]
RHGLAEERLPQGQGEDFPYFDFAEALLPKLGGLLAKTEREIRDNRNPFDRAAADALRRKSWLEGLTKGIRLVLDSVDEDAVEWVVERQRGRGGQSVLFKPVRVASFAEPLLFGHAERVLMLSATILDAPTYLSSLGIDPAEAAFIQVPSEFPPKNRPIHLRPVARLTRHQQARDLPKLVAEIAELFDTHPEDKGLIHAHSYRIAAYIAENLPARHRGRLVVHQDAGERERALELHKGSPLPTVLLTPSMTEGVDLPGDLSRWQVICKIPYPYLGDPQVARRSALDPAWYDWRTCLTVVQAYGRSVRAADDFADTYILDADFPAFLRRQRGRFPAWFVEAVQP